MSPISEGGRLASTCPPDQEKPATDGPVASPLTRVPMNTFAIAFGLAGLAATWSLADHALAAPPAVAITLWALTAIAWIWLIVTHAVAGRRSGRRLIDQLRSPVQGPIAALVPVVAMLIGGEVYEYFPALETGIVVAFIVIAALFAGWLLAQWSQGPFRIEDVHGGYFLPTGAAAFIAAGSAAKVGLHGLGLGAFAVGIFFWIVVSALILARIAVKGPLPAPLVSTLAIYVAPPAVGGLAWFALNGGRADLIAYGLAGLTAALTLMQIGLIPAYRRLAFSTGFWSFTFPYAAVARQTVDWLTIEHPALWRVWAWLVVAAITAFIAAIAVRWLLSFRTSSMTRAAGRMGTA
jgi:tellurite resistance protein